MYRHLLNAIDEIWRSDACDFVNRGCDVNDVVKLRAQFVGCFDLLVISISALMRYEQFFRFSTELSGIRVCAVEYLIFLKPSSE